MAKTKKQQQEENDQGGGGNPQKKSRTGTANANDNDDNGNVWETWEAEEEYEIDLLESRKTATGRTPMATSWGRRSGW